MTVLDITPKVEFSTPLIGHRYPTAKAIWQLFLMTDGSEAARYLALAALDAIEQRDAEREMGPILLAQNHGLRAQVEQHGAQS